MQGLTERQLVLLLRERFHSPSSAVSLAIGDDAAVLSGHADPWVMSVDASVQGVHFDRAFLSLEDVGYRAFQAALSDLAAMGAEAVVALSALILPRELTREDIDRLTRGQAQASVETRCPIVGGNISKGRELSITTTVIGRSERVLRRAGARPGEELWLVGGLGLAAAGLSCLRLGWDGEAAAKAPPEPALLRASGRRAPAGAERAAVAHCVSAWRRPQALLVRGRELVALASSGMDVSDGLAADSAQLAKASGVRIVIDAALLRTALDPSLLIASRVLRRSALRFALYGGEDYALLATGPRVRRPAWASPIGHVSRGAGVLLSVGGERTPVGAGYDHLRAR
jgi:thiamine-monophosphate kinase